MKNAIAITGGIGTGKSTVGNLLRLNGMAVLNLDEISKKFYEQNKNKIKDLFSTTNRKEVAKIAFKDKQKLSELEALLLPKILEEAKEFSTRFEKQSLPYFLEIPLFFEKQNYPISKILLVYAPKKLQIERVQKRDKKTPKEIQAILQNQIDIEKKKKLSTWVIENTKDIKHLTKEVDFFLNRLNFLSSK